MLTKRDLRYNYYTFSFLSRVWSFPAKFNRSTGKFHIESGSRRRTGFRIVLAICMAQGIMLSGRTFEASTISRDLPLEFQALGMLASASSLGIGAMGILVHRNLEIQVKLWTELLNRVNQAGGSSRRHNKKTWEELWICYMPFVLQSLVLIWPVVYSIKPNLPYSLYGNVPKAFQSTPVLVICCFLDVAMTTFYVSLSNYLVVFIMLFVRQMKLELQDLKEKLIRFGIHDRCDETAVIASQPIIVPGTSEARVTVDIKDKPNHGERMEVVNEIAGKARASIQPKVKVPSQGKKETMGEIKRIAVQGKPKVVRREVGKTGQEAERRVRREVKVQGMPEVEEIGVEANRRVVIYVESLTRCEVKNSTNSTTKNAKKRVFNRAEKWFAQKLGEWAVKHGNTWAGNRVQKWALKKAGKLAVKRANTWIVKSGSQLTEIREGKRAVAGNNERAAETNDEQVVTLEMEVVKAVVHSSDAEELKTACTTLEAFRLLFRLFNLGFANIIFLLKMVAIAVSIWGMFACIRLANRHPDFAGFYGLIAAVCVTNYIGMFNNAFHLTGQAEACKSLILLQSTTLLNREQQSKEEWNEIRCRIAAIPKLAIFSGHFHALERDSVPIFINFILNKLADLLLAF